MPPPTSTLNPASRSPCMTTRKPRSFECTSQQLSSGNANASLTFRGQYRVPELGSGSVGRPAVRATQRTALVAILLLVRPVELEELSARVGEMVSGGSELSREITPQAVALLLHLLDRAERLLGHATTTSRRPSASTWPTSGRLNSGGGSVPLRSNSRTLLPESVT